MFQGFSDPSSRRYSLFNYKELSLRSPIRLFIQFVKFGTKDSLPILGIMLNCLHATP